MVALRAFAPSPGGGAPSGACAILRRQDLVTTVLEVRVGAVDGAGTAPRGADGLLAAVGADDALVLRRVRPGEWEHVAGRGAGAPARGRGAERSAGALARDGEQQLLARAATTGAVVRVLAASPAHVAAGYRAATAAVVALGPDDVVVLGAPRRSELLLATADGALRDAARHLHGSLLPADVDVAPGGTGGAGGADGAGAPDHLPVGTTSPVDGQVVDELRALHAVQELTGALRRAPAEAVERVARVLLDALGCQLAAVWLEGGPSTVVRHPAPGAADTAFRRAGEAEVLSAARAATAGPSPAVGALGAPLRPEDGAVASLVLPLGGPDPSAGPVGGVLAVRGGPAAQPFSPLRRRIATQLVRTAGTVLAVVLAREKVEQQLSDTRLQLGRDALTDVGSRHRWDSELAAAQGLVDAGVPVAVALLDLDDLKHVNDTHGHAAGDELLRTCGAALRACLRGSSDVVARVGGDEFAVLVPRVGDVDALAARLRAGVEAARTADDLPLRVSVGAARAEPGRTVAEAVTAADAAMYQDKRRRRALRAGSGEQPARA